MIQDIRFMIKNNYKLQILDWVKIFLTISNDQKESQAKACGYLCASSSML